MLSSTGTELMKFKHWIVQKGINNPYFIVLNTHDLLNDPNRALQVEFQSMSDRLGVILRSTSIVPLEKCV